MEIRRKFESIRRPFGFNFLHFLLIEFYNSNDSTKNLIKSYPIYSIFSHVQRKFSENERNLSLIDVILTILNDDERQLIETVEKNRKDPIGSLFHRYSPMHLFLFIEPTILFNDQRIYQILRRVFIREFQNENCEWIHFAIAHRKSSTIVEFLSETDFRDDRWLISKLNVPSDRFWLPIHYAAFVGDAELIRKMSRDFSQFIDPLSFVLPKNRFRDFFSDPFDYLLRANGMKSQRSTVILSSDQDDDTPILPILDEENDDDDQLLRRLHDGISSPIRSTTFDQRKDERSDSFLADQQALQEADADIPDADQLESTIQFSRDSLLRSLIEQDSSLVYFVPSPLLLAAACPLNETKTEDYFQIIDELLQSNFVDIDGLNHRVLTEKTLEYFSRHQFANFLRTNSSPTVFYQCDALFTSIISKHVGSTGDARVSQMSDEGETICKLIYFVTVLNQRSNFSSDEILVDHLLRLHSVQIEKALKRKVFLNRLNKRTIVEHEQLNPLTQRILIRYEILDENDIVQLDLNLFLLDSFADQFADTYISLFHTPMTMLIVNDKSPFVERFFSKISSFKSIYWGNLAMFELETSSDHFFMRRGKTNVENFQNFCQIIEKLPEDLQTIQQRIFVHAFASCVKYNAKSKLEFLISTYARIFYESCEKFPTDIRHNVLAYCVIRNQSFVLEDLISAFSTLSDDNSHLFAIPLSRLSNSNLMKTQTEKSFGISSPTTNVYSEAENDYRQCRRIRNTRIANQHKANPYQRFPHQDNSQSHSQHFHRETRPRLSRFWRTVRLLQLGLKTRNETGQYVEQINNSDSMNCLALPPTTTTNSTNDETVFQRADLRPIESERNEMPTLIQMFDTDRDEQQDEIPVKGQTLLHIAAKLTGHEDVVRVLLAEYLSLTSLINANGQIPLHCAIQGGCTLTAQLLIEANPRSLTIADHQNSSVFHYCCEYKNDVLLASIFNVLRRLSSNQSIRLQALQNLVESNNDGQTPFSIACQKGSLKCLKQIFDSHWLLKRVPLSNLITSEGIKTCIDQNRVEIFQYFVSDLRRFRVLMGILIDVVFTEPLEATTDVVVGRRQYNVLEYSILLKKTDFVQLLVSVSVPRTIEQKANVDEHFAVVRSSEAVGLQTSIHDEYKRFLTRFSSPFKRDVFDQTPIQRMLKIPSLIPFVPNLLNQFVDEDGIDLSVIDDCLCSKPRSSRCIFGRENQQKSLSTSNWMKEHPLNLISQCEFAPIYDHPIVTTIVDSKADLFGNLLYFFILIIQAIYVALYTSVTLVTRTPKFYERSYVDFENVSCFDMCRELTGGTMEFDGTFVLYIFRLFLLICSCAALLKEFVQVIVQRRRYFKAFFLNLLEILAYSCGVVFSIDVNNCSKYSSIRCKCQYDFGALGVASVWTVLLLVFVNSLKLGKYGLLFITVFLTFLKFCFIYIFIWIGYLFAFHMLLTENPSFETIWLSIPRMVVMLTGEFNFENLFFNDAEPIRGSTMAKIIFTTFVFVVHICVMNILIGLAVSDVTDFQLNAKRENLRSRIRTILNFQAKFGQSCSTLARLMFFLRRRVPALLSGFKFDVSKLSIRIQPTPLATHPTQLIQCRVGYVTMRKSVETISTNEQNVENQNEKLIIKVKEIREEIDKTQLKFTQELHRLTINLSRLIEK